MWSHLTDGKTDIWNLTKLVSGCAECRSLQSPSVQLVSHNPSYCLETVLGWVRGNYGLSVAHISCWSYLPSCFGWTQIFFKKSQQDGQNLWLRVSRDRADNRSLAIISPLGRLCKYSSWKGARQGREVVGNTKEKAGLFLYRHSHNYSKKYNEIIEQHARWDTRRMLFSSLHLLSINTFQHDIFPGLVQNEKKKTLQWFL